MGPKSKFVENPNVVYQRGRWRWRVYLNEAEKSGGNLHVGNAQAAFERFFQNYPHCQSGREKILAIDLLIHEFHWILLKESQDEQTTVPHKPAGLNLLQGSTNQILEFLNTLTYGEKTAPELLANREVLLVAQNDEGQVIGYALSKPTPKVERGYDCELVAMHVPREFHRQGSGPRPAG